MQIKMQIGVYSFEGNATETINTTTSFIPPGYPSPQYESVSRENDIDNDRLLKAQKQFLDFVQAEKNSARTGA